MATMTTTKQFKEQKLSQMDTLGIVETVFNCGVFYTNRSLQKDATKWNRNRIFLAVLILQKLDAWNKSCRYSD